MEYIYSHDASLAAAALTNTLREALRSGKKVLWLMSGGSGGDVCIAAARDLEGESLDNLYVTLTDERYGPIGHADENWQQLLDKGLSLSSATVYRPLIGADPQTTTQAFGQWLTQTKQNVDMTIGLFGIGADGHTAGIKPNSPAITETTATSYYIGPDFERITITPTFIKTIDRAITQAFGSDKSHVLHELIETDLPIDRQPAQVLKVIPKSTLYSEYKKGE